MNKLLVAGATVAIAASTFALVARHEGAAATANNACLTTELDYIVESVPNPDEYNAEFRAEQTDKNYLKHQAQLWHRWAAENNLPYGQRMTLRNIVGNSTSEVSILRDGAYGVDRAIYRDETGNVVMKLRTEMSEGDLEYFEASIAKNGGWLADGAVIERDYDSENRGSGRRGEGEDQ